MPKCGRILLWDVMELPTDDADVPSDLTVRSEDILADHVGGDSIDLSDDLVKSAYQRQEEDFIEYLTDEAGETPTYPDSDARAVIADVLHLLDSNGFDTAPNDEDNAAVSMFAHPEFVDRLRAGHIVYTPEPQDNTTDDPLSVRGADVYADGMLEAGQLIAIHHDAITIPSPSSTWEPYLVKHSSGVVAATVEVDE